MKKELIAHKNPKSPISEVFRTLRTNIQFISANGKMKTLLVTSTLPGEGKSWIASNLAVTFAQAGKKVVLIDSDMRKGRLYAIFGIASKPGLSNILSNARINDTGNITDDLGDYIQQTEVENLFAMSAGNVPPNPSELLSSSQMECLLKRLKNIFDLIIIDGTPCEFVTDSVILSRIVDATMMVSAHGITKKDVLNRTIKNIRNVGGKITGVVLNKVPVSIKKYNNRYYYGAEGLNSDNEKANFINKSKIANDQKKVVDHNIENKKIKNKDVQIKENINMEDNDEQTNKILKQINEYLEEEKKDN